MSGAPVTVVNNVRGIVLMVIGAGILLLNDATAKLLTERYAIGQVVVLRQVFAVLVVLLYVQWRGQWSALRASDWRGQGLRGLCFLGTVWLMVASLSLLPLPVVTAIAFASPFFVAALSVPLLGERVGGGRWLAVLVGFLGVLVIVRPGTGAFALALLVPVGAALVNALRDIMTRRLARRDGSLAILFWSSVLVVMVSTPPALTMDWRPVAGTDWGWFALVGFLNTAAHFLMIEALRHGQAAVVAPFRYSALLWSVLVGFLVWGEVPDAAVLAGAAIIAASGAYMLRLELRGR